MTEGNFVDYVKAVIRNSFYVLVLISSFSCNQQNKNTQKCYQESQPSFFALKNEDLIKNNWVRKPENLKLIHETFKIFGYNKLFADYNIFDERSPTIFGGIYIKQSPETLIDNLELSYHGENFGKYYKEFWNRRRLENNDSIVFEIIKEINQIRKGDTTAIIVNAKFANDTLIHLLQVDFSDKIDSKIALQNFNILKKYGFHQSAYNLLYERTEYSQLNWNREKLKNNLTISKECIYPWVLDNEK
jgi:hypothetical protein